MKPPSNSQEKLCSILLLIFQFWIYLCLLEDHTLRDKFLKNLLESSSEMTRNSSDFKESLKSLYVPSLFSRISFSRQQMFIAESKTKLLNKEKSTSDPMRISVKQRQLYLYAKEHEESFSDR
ncbi:hypothetical protein L6452_35508 [Arctium lappa]|uniref:Uncharacterized protein n=1 Tax=Arctium lappa TaxID=4217 RepID=A0ACB8Y6M9_ARCLA|nr:hypothetical protein L6452_35508 [Arctium lappa]